MVFIKLMVCGRGMWRGRGMFEGDGAVRAPPIPSGVSLWGVIQFPGGARAYGINVGTCHVS